MALSTNKGKDATVTSVLEPCISGAVMSDEQKLLAEFVQMLNSYNSIEEHDSEDVDESIIREQAQLLMSLSSPVSDGICAGESVGSASETTEQLCSDDCFSSPCCSNISRPFSFTCPLLSLERQTSDSGILERMGKTLNKEAEVHPALLLGRVLNIDDRDAVRLSSDAMARNVLQSFQKSLDLRIEDWVALLAKKLLISEQQLAEQGAHSEEVRKLMQSSEALLIEKLRRVGSCLAITSVKTSFQVLPEKVDAEDEHTEILFKKQRVDTELTDVGTVTSTVPIEEKNKYHYSVSYCLKFQCLFNVCTPAGFAEVSFDVPGVIHGTFSSYNDFPENISSVVLTLDTNMLAAMMDKSCRTLVRTSVEACLEDDDHCDVSSSPATDATKRSEDITSQTQTQWGPLRPVFVTPKTNSCNKIEDHFSRPNLSILMPIPDDLNTTSNNVLPRRISPPPCSSDQVSKQSIQSPFVGEGSLKQGENTHCSLPSMVECSLLELHSKKLPIQSRMTNSQRLALVSPQLNDGVFLQDFELKSGPLLPTFQEVSSLPMLVEAAYCVEN